ncbi:OLC1v1033263C1 [Oldenlandia corymbosa var. corymbosa]|uniref:OLC1v1033263C1 n=1 Tax=Oldenlandia corymbosa var. corymbosa TaxID=529605 RepID=A0AAV1CQK2_OLDCO|nr:OLC1v1033263C1 [Oldenlandia corymbosa var. corymbosa]
MEVSQFFWFILPIIPIIFFVHKLIKSKASGPAVGKNKAPPGGRYISESLIYYSKLKKGMLYEFMKERMDKFSAKIFSTSLAGQPVVALCGPEGNKFLFSNENKLVKLWWPATLEKLLPMSDNQPAREHLKGIRKSVLLFFLKPDALREYVGTMDAVMKQHLETHWAGKDQIKVVDIANMYTLALASNFFLGMDYQNNIEMEQLVEGMDEIESAIFGLPINLPGTTLNRGIRASRILRSKMEEIIQRRKAHLLLPPRKDFISHFLTAVDENGESYKDSDIATLLVGMLGASSTTFKLTITMVMKVLADMPNVYESLLKEQLEIAQSKGPTEKLSWDHIRMMKYSWNVVCEVLRLYPSGVGGIKEAMTDFTYEGYTVPKGSKILWSLHATHRNPKFFENPDKFDPTRFEGDGPAPYTYIPFGGGSRMCPGNEYVRLAILTFIHYAVTRFEWQKLIPEEEILHHPLPHPAQGLPIRLSPRQF